MLSVHTSPLAQLGGKEAGGMNVYVRELARELGRRNVAVDIFTRSQKRGEPQITEIGANARVVTLRTGPAAPYDKNLVLDYLPEFVGRVRCFADDEDLQYDLIHSHYWVSGVAALELRKMWGTPIIQMFHTLGAMKNQVAKSASWGETDERGAIEGQLLREADAIVAATPLDRDQMIWNYAARAERIVVIPCGVDTTTFHPTPQAEARAALHLPQQPARLVLFVGRIEPLKGIDTLLRATERMVQERPAWRDDLHVLVVGGDRGSKDDQWAGEQQRLDSLAQSLGIRDNVHFVGAQPQSQLPLLYSATDVVAVPSHYESFGLVSLEAQASGAPVVASRVGGLQYTIQDGVSGFLVPYDDPDAFAGRIAQLLDDDALRQSMQAAAVLNAERYAWPRVTNELLELYTRVERLRSPVHTIAPLGISNPVQAPKALSPACATCEADKLPVPCPLLEACPVQGS